MHTTPPPPTTAIYELTPTAEKLMQSGSGILSAPAGENEDTKQGFRKQTKLKAPPTLASPPVEPNTWCLFCLSFTFCQTKLIYPCFHPFDAIRMRTAIRPKHQSLVLKCYPALPKDSGAKPNPSELSYLLYYASTRRSKLQKVGKFLEKRTASDVWRAKPG